MSNLSTITAENPLVLIGCGKMGGSMLAGWLKEGLSPDAVQIVDPFLDPVRKSFPELGNLHEAVDGLGQSLKPSFVIMAVKPQMMNDALAALKEHDLSSAVVMSVAAGKTIHYFEDHLGLDQAIVRAMPNTPAAIGKGITVCVANGPVSDAAKNICSTLLETVGDVEWIDDEALMDAVTALSGSGPAYVFYMAEAMAAAGEAIGLSPELSQKLARQTVAGAGGLLEESDETASKLRENVTSPGGTTAAALDVLMSEEGIARIIRRAMQEAKNRSKELAG
ncbi:pyrroline-5-carboxylate reductase [Pseudemcibacter aquimaris]|uniref:pyrroline-5-carboxylate reductase n=1 Tax=Pseudemcibacter aquimaris TaxID=2857064 RepID=UPI002013B8C0|nr:pyrroline-5-carboxylate reductase [Pseudemcibacter aquimaris]MCC3861008.1 pyrroline-5-carboxylate reductase [Pseudemcibacter aquimaris]WDU59826.1 pyrroline-5-carboxylate reductase [Pseudemcibacter aquimaris]